MIDCWVYIIQVIVKRSGLYGNIFSDRVETYGAINYFSVVLIP